MIASSCNTGMMYPYSLLLGVLAVVINSNRATAQTTTSASSAGSCPTVLTSSNYDAPVVGSGYTAQLVVTGLNSPRGLIFDKSGALLVVESGVGITRIKFNDRGGTCLLKDQTSALIRDNSVSDLPIPPMRPRNSQMPSSDMASNSQTTAKPYTPPPPQRSTPGHTTQPPRH